MLILRWPAGSLCFVGLVVSACGRAAVPAPAPAPAGVGVGVEGAVDPFAARAPADARVLGQVALATRADLRDAFAELESGLSASGCRPVVPRIVAARGAVGPSGMRIEIDGELDLADIACVFSAEVGADQRVVVGPVVVRGRPGGLEATVGSFRSGAGITLADRYQRLAGTESAFLVAEVGAPAQPVTVELALDVDGKRGRLVLAGPGAAAAVERALGEVAARLVGQAGGARLTVGRDGGAVRFDLRSPGATPSATKLVGDDVVRSLRVPDRSMWPGLEVGDLIYVLVGATIAVGDVIVHDDGRGPDLARVIASAGQRVQVEQGRVVIDGQVRTQAAAGTSRSADQDRPGWQWGQYDYPIATEPVGGRRARVVPFVNDGSMSARLAPGPVDVVVPPGHVFVLNDNRMVPAAGRTIPETAIIGRVALVWMSTGPDGVRWDRVLAAVE